MFIAYLRCLEPGWLPKATDVEVEFQGRFFRDPLNQSTRIWSLEETPLWKLEIIQFFGPSEYAIHVVVAYANTNTPLSVDEIYALMGNAVGHKGKFDNVSAKFFWINGGMSESHELVSKFLRDSKSLPTDAYKTINKMNVVTDGQGVAIVDESFDVDNRAIRLSQTLALSCAYQAVLNAAIDGLSTAVKGADAIEKIKVWSLFLSKYYFTEPVSTRTIELMQFYGLVRDRHRIVVTYSEVTQQLSMLARLAQAESTSITRDEALEQSRLLVQLVTSANKNTELEQTNTRTMEEFTKKFNKKQSRTASLSILIAILALLLTLLSLVQVTPKQVTNFFTAWSAPFNCSKSNSLAFCWDEISNAPDVVSKIPEAVKTRKKPSGGNSR